MNVPKLRFSEFNIEWEEEKLGNISDKISDGIHSTPKYKDGTDYFFVNGNNLMNKSIRVNENTKTVSKEEYEKYKKNLNERTILISINGTIGNLAYYANEKVVLGKSAAYINLKSDKVKEFIYNYLQTPKIKSFFNGELTGTTIKNLSLGTLKNTPLLLPNLEEQEKIASFLTKIDEKIVGLDKKKQMWEIYKKEMIQQLLNQELRFKDEYGNDYPEWEEEKFSETFEFISTNSLSRADLNDESGGVINIHYGDIHKKFSHILNFDKVHVPFINENVNLDNIKEENYCKDGDLVIVDASEDYEDIGKAIELINIGNKKVLAGLHTILARDKLGYTIGGFRSYLLLENSIKLQLKKLATGVSVLGVSKTNLGKIDLKIPSIQEQIKIASFLSSIYAKLELINKEIEINKKFKKGLLQQMFC